MNETMPQKQRTAPKSRQSPYKFKESDYIDTLIIYQNPLSFRQEVEEVSKKTLSNLRKSYLFTLQSLDIAKLFANPYTTWIYEQQVEVYREALLYQLDELSTYW